MTAAENTRLALIFNRPAYFVAARKAVDIRTMFGQPRQKVREILQLLGNNMDHARFLLHTAGNRHIAGVQDDRSQTFEDFRPHDYIRDRGLVFDGHEDHAVGGTRPLPAT